MNPVNPNLVAVEDSKDLDELIDSENIALALRAYLEKDKRTQPRKLRIDLTARRLMSRAAAVIEHLEAQPEPDLQPRAIEVVPDWEARYWRMFDMNERLLTMLEK